MQPVLLHTNPMKRPAVLALAALLTLSVSQAAVPTDQAFSVKATWIQFMPGGGAEIRAVAVGHCPTVGFALKDGKTIPPTPMQLRAAPTADFPMVCSQPIPDGATKVFAEMAEVGPAKQIVGLAYRAPVPDPQRILVLGDTGCRIKGTYLQACNDPKAWPFAGLAKAAAALKPDLIIHLGDYLYRESPCPAGNAGCAGSPWGDNWASWDADFFAPAQPLLDAAPLIIIRGNHEDCFRAGPGFLRLMGPAAFDPAAPCTAHLPPYLVQAGSQAIAVMDSAAAADTPLDEAAVPTYVQDFEALKAMANIGPGHELWLATHRPIWGVTTFMGAPAGGNATMIKAAGDLSVFNAISLMLSGHIHTFEAINYDAKIPPQIVAGHGGDNLDPTPADLRGTIFQGDSGVHVKTGLSVGGFGFLLLTREKGNDGWTIELYDSDGKPIKQCAYVNRAIFCLAPR